MTTRRLTIREVPVLHVKDVLALRAQRPAEHMLLDRVVRFGSRQDGPLRLDGREHQIADLGRSLRREQDELHSLLHATDAIQHHMLCWALCPKCEHVFYVQNGDIANRQVPCGHTSLIIIVLTG